MVNSWTKALLAILERLLLKVARSRTATVITVDNVIKVVEDHVTTIIAVQGNTYPNKAAEGFPVYFTERHIVLRENDGTHRVRECDGTIIGAWSDAIPAIIQVMGIEAGMDYQPMIDGFYKARKTATKLAS
jgi:hypothetical protein